MGRRSSSTNNRQVIHYRNERRIKQLSNGTVSTRRVKQLSTNSRNSDMESFWATGESTCHIVEPESKTKGPPVREVTMVHDGLIDKGNSPNSCSRDNNNNHKPSLDGTRSNKKRPLWKKVRQALFPSHTRHEPGPRVAAKENK